MPGFYISDHLLLVRYFIGVVYLYFSFPSIYACGHRSEVVHDGLRTLFWMLWKKKEYFLVTGVAMLIIYAERGQRRNIEIGHA